MRNNARCIVPNGFLLYNSIDWDLEGVCNCNGFEGRDRRFAECR